MRFLNIASLAFALLVDYAHAGTLTLSWADNSNNGEIPGIGSQKGNATTPIDPDWTDDQSFQGGGLGNGDYRPGVSTELVLIPSAGAPFSFDMNGTALTNDGNDYIGALQD